MTLQQLRYAVCIAKNKSMNKAAAELFISQPSLSVTIRDLEEEIGFPLFQRSSRGIVITAEGEDFLGYARQMIEQYRLMEEKFIEKKMQKQKNAPAKEVNPEKKKLDAVYQEAEEKMKTILGTKVIINQKDSMKGKIEIEYYSPDELTRIYELIESIKK